MQAVAAEMNLSETAFLLEQHDGYRLRWFTPKIEVDLCGHATLASAHVLWSEGRVPLEGESHFHTNSGLLKACRRGDLIELDFPSESPSQVEPPTGRWRRWACRRSTWGRTGLTTSWSWIQWRN
jgi:predicted PhzF superfamily epimerase YddE/YHI9